MSHEDPPMLKIVVMGFFACALLVIGLGIVALFATGCGGSDAAKDHAARVVLCKTAQDGSYQAETIECDRKCVGKPDAKQCWTKCEAPADQRLRDGYAECNR